MPHTPGAGYLTRSIPGIPSVINHRFPKRLRMLVGFGPTISSKSMADVGDIS